MYKIPSLMPAGTLVLFLLLGCGAGDGGSGSVVSATADAHGVVLPAGVESKFPLPTEAIARTNTEHENDTRAIFTIPMSYPDGVEFFNTGFASHGWNTEHAAGEKPHQGARWDAEGHGVNLVFTLSGPMGRDGPLTGTLMVHHPD